ncbi:Fc.00g063460.m01.CDS01 [Cosmosporella sp. VM-42]
MGSYVEFYVTCNPPLLPIAVAKTVYYALRRFGQEGNVIEILYEPDVPWFKIIANSGDLPEVIGWFDSCLESLLELETGLVDQDLDGDVEISVDDHHSLVDVEVLAEQPQVIPWSLYHGDESTAAFKYDYRFPEAISLLSNKEVWRGLESVEGLTLPNLLSKFSFLWSTNHPVEQLMKLEAVSDCLITHNMRGDVVYLGSDSGVYAVENGLRKLWNLFGLWHAKSSGTRHLVFTEGEGPFQLFYRYLSHLELFSLTYVDAHAPEQEKEYTHLLHAAAIRVQTQGQRGRWIPDQKVYNRAATSSIGTWKPFSAFADYQYTCKRPYAALPIARKQLSPEVTRQTSQVFSSNQTLDSTSTKDSAPPLPAVRVDCGLDVQFVGAHLSDAPKELAASRNPSKGIVANERIATAHPRARHEFTCVDQPESRPETPASGPDPVAPQAQSRPIDAVNSWIAAVEQSSGSQNGESIDSLGDPMLTAPNVAHQVTNLEGPFDDEPLIDLTSETASPSCRSLGKRDTSISEVAEPQDLLLLEVQPMPQPPRVRYPPLSHEGLMDQGSPEKRFDRMFSTLEPSRPGVISQPISLHASSAKQAPSGSLLVSFEPQIHSPSLLVERQDWLRMATVGEQLVNSDSDERTPEEVKAPSPLTKENEDQLPDQTVACFKREDPDKETFETMRQQASRPDTWAQVASNSKGKDRALPRNDSPQQTIRGTSQGTSIRASVVQSRSSTPHSSEVVQIVPGLDATVSTSSPMRQSKPIGHSATLKKASEEIKDLMRVLQVTPGKVRVDARFGRAGIKGLPPSIMKSEGGLASPMDQVLEALNERNTTDAGLGFHTILTTNGEEADVLPRSHGLRGGIWKLCENNAYYDLFCTRDERTRDEGSREQFRIEVDAETFEYHCRSKAKDLSGLVVHCAQRAWDIKVCVSYDENPNIPEDFKHFAKDVVASLGISISAEGEVVVEAKQDTAQEFIIAGINVRNVAKYKSEVGGSCLTITMTRSVKRHGAFWHNTSVYRGSTRAVTIPGEAAPTQWFEASVTSTRMEEVLMENIGLELGEMATWEPEELLKQDMVQEMVDPALRMITQMDAVGCTNDHGQKHNLEQQFYDPTAEQQRGHGSWCYW